MDFITKLPRSSGRYATIWVIVDKLTKSTYFFLVIRKDYKLEKLSRLYITEIVVRHGVPVSIISNRDGRFTSRYHASVRCAPFEALYGSKCRPPVLWDEIEESRLIEPELVQETTDKVILIKERLKTARGCQNSYADNRRKLLEFEVGDQVLLKVSSWKGAKYLADENLHVPLEEINVDKTLRFVEELVEIIDRGVKSLKRSKISIVKVHWNSKRGHEDFMKTEYPHLLIEQAIVEVDINKKTENQAKMTKLSMEWKRLYASGEFHSPILLCFLGMEMLQRVTLLTITAWFQLEGILTQLLCGSNWRIFLPNYGVVPIGG
ncbi:putative reverse transcriptase domain-containing protein [Tanacetum coccineum]|uniref:Reverse transcriptase domain-containing protein n=1 Tax=Tanacetum coccineum TaxID=301880 RepID=A0ABQ4X9J5_9ASTR